MTFISALLLGLLGSTHCALMCGGLQSALQQPLVLRSEREGAIHLLAMNLGRLFTYLCAGILFSALGFSLVKAIDIPAITQVTRYMMAAILLLMGIQLLCSNKKPFAALEAYGESLWRSISKVLATGETNKFSSSFRTGLIWGFMPCGLVYGVLLTTLLANSVLQGAQIMLGFGLGTLPAMVLTGGLYMRLRSLLRNRMLRVFGGAIFIQGAALMVIAPWVISTEFMNAYPELMSTVFCLAAT